MRQKSEPRRIEVPGARRHAEDPPRLLRRPLVVAGADAIADDDAQVSLLTQARQGFRRSAISEPE
jgi:hypothetical protein